MYFSVSVLKYSEQKIHSTQIIRPTCQITSRVTPVNSYWSGCYLCDPETSSVAIGDIIKVKGLNRTKGDFLIYVVVAFLENSD